MRKIFSVLFFMALALISRAQTERLVISQVYGGGGNTGADYKNDFIEIFNPTSTTVQLTGWSVQYASSTGTSWTNKTNLKDSIKPGQYYLIQGAAGSGGNLALPTPDVTGTINLSGTTGKVVLIKSTTAIASGTSCPTGSSVVADFVGFGGANCFEGSGPTLALSNTTAAIRKDGGCQDEGKNVTDFEIKPPVPRNTQSKRKICGQIEDLTPPSINKLQPEHNASAVSQSVEPTIEFNEPILAATGNITVKDLSKGTELVIPITAPAVRIDANILRLELSLKPLRQYSITIDAGALKDAAGNSFTGLDTWTFTTGEQQLSFNFNDCSGKTRLSGGFTQYSVTGNIVWECTTFGQNSNGIQINGFVNNAAQENEDWLLSPQFDLSEIEYPLLTFSTRSKFTGPALRLMVSTDYSSRSDPRTAHWTELKGRFPDVDSDIWTATREINLRAYKGENVTLAFVYKSSLSTGASRWTLDDIEISKSATAPAPGLTFAPAELDFDYIPSGKQSETQRITIGGYNLQGDLTLQAPQGFEVSVDSAQFGKSVVFKQDDAESNKLPIYVRFAPVTINTEYSDSLKISSTNLDRNSTLLTGSSLRALKVVNWNIEWFGSPVQTPSNDYLQQQNVQTILKKTNADIYALSEVVDTARLQAVVAAMPGYEYVVSDFGSHADSATHTGYPLVQKLAFVYRSEVVEKLAARGVLRSGASAAAYNNWASGRFPYLMNATVKLDGIATNLNLVLVHGKANTGDRIEAWERRKGGAAELKDTLDKDFPYSNVVILGDFNDDFDETIAPSIPGNVSSYIDFLKDTVAYKPLTLPLSLAGRRSTVSYDNVIDHQMASNEMGISYVPGSVKILTSVVTWVSNYGPTTSDHYPVVARYDLRFFKNPIDHKNFNGEVDGNKTNLNWITSHQINSSHFVVERSRNGMDFEAVDSTSGKGDSRTTTYYKLAFSRPWPGQSHYRLRSVSLDGSVTYSPVITLNMKSNSHLLVNTANRAEAVLAYTSEAAEPALVQLYDLNGRMYFTKRMNFARGRNVRRIDTRHLPAGVYFVRVVHENGIETEKVFIGN